MQHLRAWISPGIVSLLIAGTGNLLAAGPDERQAPAPKKKAAARDRAEPPPCVVPSRGAARAPARTMPEMFERMGSAFARDPARGFEGFLEELAGLEGPALEGIVLTPAEERQAGLKARVDYLDRARARGFRVAEDPRKLAYLRALVDRFSARMARRDRYPSIEITLIDAPIPDGQSFPGGLLLFTTGLLDEPDEATVAGVVAHELAHLDRGHLYGYARRSKLAEATYREPPGDFGGLDRLFTRQAALLGLMMNPFRPGHESEADCTSTTWLYLEGYDPRGLVGFFERLHRRSNDQPADPAFAFGRTHPFSLDRRRDVLDRLAQLQRWRRREDLGLFAENLRKLEPRPAN